MEERKLTEKESLSIITEMIARTKKRYIGNGNNLLMWGYLIIVTSLAVWLLLSITNNPAYNWLWFAIPIIGSPTTVIMSRRERRDNACLTYSDKIVSRLWTIVGLSTNLAIIICVILYFGFKIDSWQTLLVYPLLIVSFAEIAQGLIIREKSLIFGGFIGLSMGIIINCLFSGANLPLNYYLPLALIAFIAMMIVPGHIINHKARTNERA